jgi:nuclease-like protein/AAA domain-containing protein
MAQLFPSVEVIDRLTAGERHLLSTLQGFLDNSFEVYCQPYLNGDRPDIIVVRRGYGVLIIEVKDWRLVSYRLGQGKYWTLEKNGSQVKSPLVQAFEYKRNLYELHIDTFLERKIASPDLFDLVGCLVYFHTEDTAAVRDFLGRRMFTAEDHLKEFGNFQVAGRDEVTAQGIGAWIRRSGLLQPDQRFDDTLYSSFRRYLQPPFHPAQDGEPLTYPGGQAALTESRPGQQKIIGVAGSGKTMVLARRAVNAYKRTGSQVLILTYNITLRNYIHDKISQVREDFAWDSFIILHFHEFFKSMTNNLELPITRLTEFDREDFFESTSGRTPRFAAIFVDEVQDYKVEWLRSLRKYFLHEEGEFVLFGDEKQNIYGRGLEVDRKPKTNIPRRWNELNTSFRLSDHIVALATAYQKHFFEQRYDLDTIEVPTRQRPLFDVPHHLEYFDRSEAWDSLEAVYKLYCDIGKRYGIHPNDFCIVSSKTPFLRDLDYRIRTKRRERTMTMFESKEVYDQLCRQIENPKELEDTVQAVRTAKKFHFWMNSGTVKLATIHSFKGWEINTLILILYSNETRSRGRTGEDSRECVLDEELGYTAITRCRHNLFVINLGDRKYHNFFLRAVRAINKDRGIENSNRNDA